MMGRQKTIRKPQKCLPFKNDHFVKCFNITSEKVSSPKGNNMLPNGAEYSVLD